MREKKREGILQGTKNKPTSLREVHINKDDNEKRTYNSLLNDEYLFDNNNDDDSDEIKEKIKEKNFEKPKIKIDIPSTDSQVIINSEQTKNSDYSKNEDNQALNDEKWYTRIRIYWIRSYPELIVKEILVKIVGTLIVGILSFVGGFLFKDSISNKRIENLKQEFNIQITTTTEKIFNELYNKKIDDINSNIDNKIDSRLNILEAIEKAQK